MAMFRLISGSLLVIVGIPLWILPIPLGLPLVTAGSVLILTGSPAARRKFVAFGRTFPKVWRRYKTWRRARAAEAAQPPVPQERPEERADRAA